METCVQSKADPRPRAPLSVGAPARAKSPGHGQHGSNDVPLALQERDKWVALLRAFERGEYRSKAQEFVPSFGKLLDSLCLKPGVALDAGCGSGLLGRRLLTSGWSVEGIDILPEAVEMATQSFPTTVGDIADMPYPTDSFDLVLCSMVLMLVEDVRAACEELIRVTRPGGALLVAIVNPAASDGTQESAKHAVEHQRLRHWRFEVNGLFHSVRYYWRPLALYHEVLAQDESKPSLFSVGTDGLLSRFDGLSAKPQNSEYLWFAVSCKK